MTRYAFLRLQYNANKVIADCETSTLEEAVEKFRKMCGDTLMLDDSGYGKIGDVSFCIAEYHENFAILP
jgi:hypothetical protein